MAIPASPPVDRSRFIGNTAALAAATGAAALLSLAQIKILSDSLAPSEFGRFAAMRGLALLVSMLAANGLPALLVRYLPGHEVSGNRRRAALLTGSSVALCALLVWIFMGIVASNGGSFPHRSGMVLARAVPGHGFALLAFGVALKLIVYGGFNGLRRFGTQTLLEGTGLAVQVAWIFSDRASLTVDRLLFILGVVSIGTVVVGLPWLAVRLLRDVRPGNVDRGQSAAGSSDYLSYWVGATGLSVVAVAFSDVDRWVFSRVVAFDVLSFFHVGARIVRLIERFMAVPVVALQPEITRLDVRGRRDEADAATGVFIRFSVVVGTLAAAYAAAYAPLIVRVASNERYGSAAVLVAAMAVGVPFAAVTAPLTTVMKARDAVARALLCDLVWAVVYLGTAVVLIVRIGVLGAGIAFAAARGAQLATAVVASGNADRQRLTAAWSYAIRLVAPACVACAVPVVVLAVWGESGLAARVVIIWAPVGVLLYRQVVRMLGLLSANDRASLAALLSSRGLSRLASWV